MTDKKRSYKQFCSVARAMDVLGERWTLLIVRDLLLGPWRYSDFLARLPGITTNLLADRLRDMEANGLIQKFQQASVGSPHVYELTELGWKLEPVILSLASFGQTLLASGPKKGDQADIGRALLSLKLRCRNLGVGLVTLRFDATAADGPPLYYQVKYSAGYVDVRHGKPWQSEVEIALSAPTMTGLLFRQSDAGLLEKRGEIVVSGSRPQWRVFLKNFGLKYTTPK
jgi:DNA-binding HxlR family transcriptional regulator